MSASSFEPRHHRKDHCLPLHPAQRRGHAVAGSAGDVIPASPDVVLFTISNIRGPPCGGREPFDPNNTRPSGGARRDRTDDLMLAKHALSQLSYGPTGERTVAIRGGPGTTRTSDLTLIRGAL